MIRIPTHAGNRCRQRGFSIVAAIFVLVVLGMLGAYMVDISGVAHTTAAYAAQGARAYRAAASGAQWARRRAFTHTGATCGANPSTPEQHFFNFTGGGLNGFSVEIECSYTRHQEQGDCFNVFLIFSISQYGSYGNRDFASRRVRLTATDRASPLTGCP